MKEFRVICRLDRTSDGAKGKYTLATSKEFATSEEALAYAKTVCSSREPKVLMVVMDSKEIHPPEEEPLVCTSCSQEVSPASVGYIFHGEFVCRDCRHRMIMER